MSEPAGEACNSPACMWLTCIFIRGICIGAVTDWGGEITAGITSTCGSLHQPIPHRLVALHIYCWWRWIHHELTRQTFQLPSSRCLAHINRKWHPILTITSWTVYVSIASALLRLRGLASACWSIRTSSWLIPSIRLSRGGRLATGLDIVPQCKPHTHTRAGTRTQVQ